MQIQKISGITSNYSKRNDQANYANRNDQTSFGTKWGVAPTSWLEYIKLPGYVKSGIASAIGGVKANGIDDSVWMKFKNGEWRLDISSLHGDPASVPVNFKNEETADKVETMLVSRYKVSKGIREDG